MSEVNSVCEGAIDAEKYISRDIMAKVTSFPGRSVIISAGKCQTLSQTLSNILP